MATVRLQFELTDEVEIEQNAQIIEQRLSTMHIVEKVKARPQEETRFTGLEVVAAISVAIMVTRSSGELVEELRKLITELKGLYGDIKGLKEIFVEIRGKHIPLDKMSEENYEQLSATTKL